MSSLRRTCVVALAAGLVTLGLAAPARADRVSGSCLSGSGDRLTAYADFTVGGDGWRTWYYFAGRPYRAGNGNSNNVNFYFYQDGAQHWTNFSPDNVHNGAWYTAGANIHMPPWSYQEVRWEAIFDWSFAGDPDCSAFGSP
jgi:hypothetical protein